MDPKYDFIIFFYFYIIRSCLTINVAKNRKYYYCIKIIYIILYYLSGRCEHVVLPQGRRPMRHRFNDSDGTEAVAAQKKKIK